MRRNLKPVGSGRPALRLPPSPPQTGCRSTRLMLFLDVVGFGLPPMGIFLLPATRREHNNHQKQYEASHHSIHYHSLLSVLIFGKGTPASSCNLASRTQLFINKCFIIQSIFLRPAAAGTQRPLLAPHSPRPGAGNRAAFSGLPPSAPP